MTVAPTTLEFLTWLAVRPRTYADVMEAWQTSCPRLSAWEDALADGLIEKKGRSSNSLVELTKRGRLIVQSVA